MSNEQIINELALIERAAYLTMKEAELLHIKAKRALCEEIESRGVSAVEWGDQVISRIASERVKINEARFKELVSADTWDKVVVEKVDSNSVRELILSGDITSEVIDAAIEITTSSPYLRYGTLEVEGEKKDQSHN